MQTYRNPSVLTKLTALSSLLFASVALTACQTAPIKTIDPMTHTAPEISTITPNYLASYHWKLINATDKAGRQILPLMDKSIQPKLTFNPTTSNANPTTLGVTVGCNHAGGQYSLTNNMLNAPQMMSTMMGCPSPMDKAEPQLIGLMQGTSRLAVRAGDTPILTQVTQDNATLVWQGTQTARSRYAQTPDIVFLAVAPTTKACVSNPAQQCLQVKPVSYVNDKKVVTGDWQVLDGTIEGYTHSPNEARVIRVQRYSVSPTPNASKQYAYVLDQIIESAVVNNK